MSYMYNREMIAGPTTITTDFPVGGICIWPGTIDKIPFNYMLCEGQTLSKLNYPTLFDKIGYTYGGSGNNFNLPDYKNRVVAHLGTDANFNTLGKKSGSAGQDLSAAIGNVNGLIYSMGWKIGNKIPGVGYSYSTPNMGGANTPVAESSINHATPVFRLADGAQPSMVQPTITQYYIIKVKEEIYFENIQEAKNILDELVSTINSKFYEERIDLTPLLNTTNCREYTEDPPWAKLSAKRIGDRVILSGILVAKIDLVNNANLLTLPENFRPWSNQIIPVFGNTIGSVNNCITINVRTDGQITLRGTCEAAKHISLSGIVFDVR